MAALVIFAAVLAAVVLLVPGLRFSLVGARLSYDLQPGSQDKVNILSMLSRGTEIRSLTEEGLTVPDLKARPATHDLRLTLTETVRSAESEQTLDYRVVAVHSEQLGTTGGHDLIGGSYRVRVLPTGLLADVSQSQGKSSKVLDLAGVSQMLAAWWPGLPGTKVRPGSTWTGRWEVPLDLSLLKESQVVMQHRMTCTLQDFVREKGLWVARIQVSGNLVPQVRGDLPSGITVAGTGREEGTVMVDLVTGRTLLADDRTAWSVVLRQPAEGHEVVYYADRKSRLWRPHLVPDGYAGFNSQLPIPGGSSAPPSSGAPPVAAPPVAPAPANPVPAASPSR